MQSANMSEHYLRDDLLSSQQEVHGRGLLASRDIARNTELGQCKVKPAGYGSVLWLDDEGEERYRVLAIYVSSIITSAPMLPITMI